MKTRLIVTGILILITGAFFSSISLFQASESGVITVLLYDGDHLVSEEVIAFKKGDTLLGIMNENYEIICMNASYEPDSSCEIASFLEVSGRIILEIDSLKSNWTSSYIEIEINGEKSIVGIDTLKFKDEDVIWFRLKSLE
jgi:hypothetical protein